METKKENTNKKRIAIVLVVLLLLLAIGATAGITLAKYLSSADISSTTATVAKWGYTITADSGLFGSKYGSVNGNFATKISDGTGVVVSSNSSNVVAPGTKGSATVLTINGSSEVDAVLTINVSEFQTIHLTDSDSTNYYPIKWTVNNKVISVDSNAVTANDLASEIAAAFNASGILSGNVKVTVSDGIVTVELPANSTITNFKLTISWEWALQTAKESNGGFYDAEDTILGQIAQAGGTDGTYSSYAGSSWKINLGLSASIAQVQKFPSQDA